MAKKVISITVDKGLFYEWKKYTDEMCINSSKLIEKLMKVHLENNRGES